MTKTCGIIDLCSRFPVHNFAAGSIYRRIDDREQEFIPEGFKLQGASAGLTFHLVVMRFVELIHCIPPRHGPG